MLNVEIGPPFVAPSFKPTCSKVLMALDTVWESTSGTDVYLAGVVRLLTGLLEWPLLLFDPSLLPLCRPFTVESLLPLCRPFTVEEPGVTLSWLTSPQELRAATSPRASSVVPKARNLCLAMASPHISPARYSIY